MKIFIGYDSREQEAYDICHYSIKEKTGDTIPIGPLKQSDLRNCGLYTRPANEPASTEFTFTRFLIPQLYAGQWALFVDCDFVFTASLHELFALCDPKYAVMCCKHDYIPKAATKMDGQKQTAYPRKNWSSLVLFNCQHPANKVLTSEIVNSSPGSFLHRFQWLTDDLIGDIPIDWNYLVGEYPKLSYAPKGIHYTNGGPWFPAYEKCDYHEIWTACGERLKESKIKTVGICYTKNSIHSKLSYENFVKGVLTVGDRVVKIHDIKEMMLLDQCHAMFQVSEANMSSPDNEFRQKLKLYADEKKKPRLVIDTGFVKNKRFNHEDLDRYMALGDGGIKRKARYFNEHSPSDRWKKLKFEMKPWRTTGKHILVIGQNEVGISSQHINVLDWWSKIIQEINELTNRPVLFRKHPSQRRLPIYGIYKPSPFNNKDIIQDLQNDIWCVVARTTNGAVDAILNGIPVITPDDWSMAYDVAGHDIKQINNPPTPDRTQWAYDLAYCQWAFPEYASGEAWLHYRNHLWPPEN